MASGNNGERDYCSGKLVFGSNVRNGNTNQKDYTVELEAKRRTAQSRFIASYLGLNSTIDDIATENNHRVNASFDWFISHKVFLRVLTLEIFRDPFQNIALRATTSTEVGYRLCDNNVIYWDVAGGPGYQQTQFDSVDEGEDEKEGTAAGKLSTDFEWNITGDIEYTFHYDALSVSARAGERIHHMKTGIEFELSNDFNLEIRYLWDRIDKPAADEDGRVPNKEDSRFVISLGYEF